MEYDPSGLRGLPGVGENACRQAEPAGDSRRGLRGDVAAPGGRR